MKSMDTILTATSYNKQKEICVLCYEYGYIILFTIDN